MKIKGSKEIPRVAVFRSNKHILVQVIDDETSKTLMSASDIKADKMPEAIGQALGKKIVAAGISKIVFDRGGHKYHGRVKSVAEGLRKSGVKF